MNEEISAAMRQTYQEMGEAILTDERRMASFLADILGNRYPGERLLLRQLVQTGLPRMIAEGGVTADNLPHKAAYVAEKYLWREDATLAAVRVWFETLKGVKLPPAQAKQTEAPPMPPKQPTPPPAPSRPHRTPPPETRKPPTYTNTIGMEFVLIPAGTFLMGSPDDDKDAFPDEKPQHNVTISRPFYLGKYPVTQAQWKAVMGRAHCYFSGEGHPVEGISWDDTQKFIHTLNTREGHKRYRLPTEAEWEYACRAGTTTRYCFGDDEAVLGDYAWHSDNSRQDMHVGQKLPNAWGLYDMHGNVCEWVQDRFGLYSAGSVVDPRGPSVGEDRVLRNGCWRNEANACRAACRSWLRPDKGNGFYGFRLALSLEE